MIKSMTGFGKAVAEIPGKKLTIEVKTLNSKGLDLNLKIPAWLRVNELEIRNSLATLKRGKIELLISSESTGEQIKFSINKPLALKYHQELKALQDDLSEASSEELLPLVLKMPDIYLTSKEEIDSAAWDMVWSEIERAIKEADSCRTNEGSVLEKDILARIEAILTLLKQIEPLENERKERVRLNLRNELDAFSSSNGAPQPDQNRFEQELIYYLEKMDFTEEKVRLKKHCDYFLQTMNEKESQGKKLGFICQEMGREINTLGSKASHAEIQKIVIQMKDELEKVKEQLLNIV